MDSLVDQIEIADKPVKYQSEKEAEKNQHRKCPNDICIVAYQLLVDIQCILIGDFQKMLEQSHKKIRSPLVPDKIINADQKDDGANPGQGKADEQFMF